MSRLPLPNRERSNRMLDRLISIRATRIRALLRLWQHKKHELVGGLVGGREGRSELTTEEVKKLKDVLASD